MNIMQKDLVSLRKTTLHQSYNLQTSTIEIKRMDRDSILKMILDDKTLNNVLVIACIVTYQRLF